MLVLSEESLQVLLSLRRRVELEEGVHVPSVKDTRALADLLAHAARSSSREILQLHNKFMKTLNFQQVRKLSFPNARPAQDDVKSSSLADSARNFIKDKHKRKKMIYRGLTSWL